MKELTTLIGLEEVLSPKKTSNLTFTRRVSKETLPFWTLFKISILGIMLLGQTFFCLLVDLMDVHNMHLLEVVDYGCLVSTLRNRDPKDPFFSQECMISHCSFKESLYQEQSIFKEISLWKAYLKFNLSFRSQRK